MGFGVSGASAVIFLGLFLAAGTLYATTSQTAERVADARDDDSERLLDQRNTAINVTDAVHRANADEFNVTVENTGTTTLAVNDTTVLADNEYVSTANATVDGASETDLWAPGATLRLTVNRSSAPERVKVVTETGVADSRSVRAVN